ncbi:FtsX-like permease family protein [Kineosporia sp. J2-2]|uniref:FtsX-like permease family protein n=1 Tax=Kineosporia corallincola TaxID=2835133 RepID=A0ABS5TNI3_9ACTN|nr:ABC transporter permease [Kineosporia corallincola]MBT0772665.1 FtsX-like permease family protein [Kineosporia corallincola]
MRAWIPAWRVARRDVWRHKGRSALVALMIALPVLALSSVSVLFRSDDRDPQDVVRVELGVQAQAEITYAGFAPVVQSPAGNGYDSGTVIGDDKEDAGDENLLSTEEFEQRAASVISSRDQLVRDRTLDANRNLRWQDRLLSAGLRELDYTGSGLKGLIEQVSGRAPQAAGEVVVSRKLQDAGVRVGDTLTYQPSQKDEARTLTVVGVVDGIDIEKQVIGPAGSLFPEGVFRTEGGFLTYAGAFGEARLLVTGPDPVTWDQVLDLNQSGSVVLSRQVVADPPPSEQVPYNDGDYAVDGESVGIVAVVIGMVLLQIALLAGPAIAVGARRNQRTLALMASSGAERRHLRAVLLASNGLIGLVSSAVAAVLGAGLGIAIIAVLRAHDVTFVRVDVRPLDLLVLVATGTLTAVAASLVPARQAARLDVVAALTGRRDYSPPALRVPVAGLLLALAGTVLALVSSGEYWTFPTVLGLAVAEVGMVMASGAVVALAARLAVRLPFSARFALRDAARQRSRTAPAVAAVLAAIAGGSAALVYLAAQDDHDQREYRASTATGVLVVGADTYGDNQAVDALSVAEGVVRRDLPVESLQTFRTSAWEEDEGDVNVSLTPLMPDDVECPGTAMEGIASVVMPGDDEVYKEGTPGPCGGRSDPGTLEFGYGNVFDDGTAVDLITGGQAPTTVAALRAGTVVSTDPEMIWPDGTVHVAVERYTERNDTPSSVTTITLKAVLAGAGESNINGLVYPTAAAEKLGIGLEDGGFVAATTRMPTTAQEERTDEALLRDAGLGLSLERGYVSHYGTGLLSLLVAAAVISLIGTFTAVGLAAAETRADVSTLAAVGAGPGVRRRLAAAQAGVISGLGGVLGVLSGILAGWVLVRMQQDWTAGYGDENLWRLVLPWNYLLAVGLGIPLLAMVIGFLTTRSRLAVVRRLGQ